MEFSDLYSNRILEIAGAARQMPRLENPDATARKVSRVCGSVVEVDLKLGGGRVEAYGATVNACALGQTSAAIVAEHIIGSTPDELRTVRDQMTAMLRADGVPPNGRWDDLKYLEPVREFPARHASTLLVFDAIVDALERAGA
ncbi:iron-sulfur cluster assembly scaffold protein [Pelagibacterium halotolerans]|uniref:Putative iron-sulfur cluster assembly scaffold protein for SUF system, SufE2 n=1 Tax=Pelagibacterium halotolerans (strain DSM 22347 / JCM 15775 / CGMCC 1.7692 / B2) TaxID=1082931 RepID=G4RDH0_PELHB|nr:iron-sulfur cluster assembly scaffold protein [Pelagibacterium halotolerans]AEQ51771.1 putative iron-sulfur cluster assembly scaffold protein for SUF system, SufE2 [Pelagibacterium halotolerans B2]QJR18415.1 iron-sulfur cluster assembly scaffold protein [Pelagibacterium halotolerans]SEA22923.1 NifU homolog involved in Fe-S cluster formation [Pelagibacterium halotolerans]